MKTLFFPMSFLLFLLLIVGCSGDFSPSPPVEINGEDPLALPEDAVDSDPNSLEFITTNVFNLSCASERGGCHFDGGFSPELHSVGEAWQSLVKRPALRAPEPMFLVEPGDPEASYLMWRLQGSHGEGVMPLGSEGLPAEDIARIESWILEGAPLSADDPGTAISINLAPAQPKVQFLINGKVVPSGGQNISPGDEIVVWISTYDLEDEEQDLGVSFKVTIDFGDSFYAEDPWHPGQAIPAFRAEYLPDEALYDEEDRQYSFRSEWIVGETWLACVGPSVPMEDCTSQPMPAEPLRVSVNVVDNTDTGDGYVATQWLGQWLMYQAL